MYSLSRSALSFFPSITIEVDDSTCLSFPLLMLSLLSFLINLLYNRTIGEIAGNIIAAIPIVQLTVNNAIAIESYVIIAFIISGWSFDITHASAEVETNVRRIIFCSLFMTSQIC